MSHDKITILRFVSKNQNAHGLMQLINEHRCRFKMLQNCYPFLQ